MNRNEIAAELLRGCPTESLADHQALATAIRRGDSTAAILAMPETDAWPETCVWLKTELAGLDAAATLGRKGGQANTEKQNAARAENAKKGGRPRAPRPYQAGVWEQAEGFVSWSEHTTEAAAVAAARKYAKKSNATEGGELSWAGGVQHAGTVVWYDRDGNTIR